VEVALFNWGNESHSKELKHKRNDELDSSNHGAKVVCMFYFPDKQENTWAELFFYGVTGIWFREQQHKVNMILHGMVQQNLFVQDGFLQFTTSHRQKIPEAQMYNPADSKKLSEINTLMGQLWYSNKQSPI